MKTSELEEVFADKLREMGIRDPRREYAFASSIGRRFRFDFAWPEDMVYVEIEGGVWIDGRHNRAGGYMRDTEKYNLATMLGWKGLRFTTDDLKKNLTGCAEMVAELLGRPGEDEAQITCWRSGGACETGRA